jgi:hypothetical protein
MASWSRMGSSGQRTQWIEAGGQEKVKGPPFVKHGGLCVVLLPRVRFQQPGLQLLVCAF